MLFEWRCCHHIFFCWGRPLPKPESEYKGRRSNSSAAKSLQQLLIHHRSDSNVLSHIAWILASLLSNSVQYHIAAHTRPLSIQLHASFLLALDPLKQMLLHSLVHASEIFRYAGLIFQFLVETPCYFQSPVVFCSNQTPNHLESAILEAVNW